MALGRPFLPVVARCFAHSLLLVHGRCRPLSEPKILCAAACALHARQRSSGSAPAGQSLASMPIEYLTPSIEDRALAVQSALADRGQHRAPSIPDLLNAAAAELAQLTVLHLDQDFELIADITGQPVERLRLI